MDQTITLEDLSRILRGVWRVLVCGFLVGGALGVALSFWMDPVYRAQTKVFPARSSDSSDGLGNVGERFGGLAALAGINLSARDDRAESIEFLKSRTLVEQFITQNRLLPVLFAEEWDAARATWRSARPDKQPTLSDGVREFSRDVRRISEDKRTGVIAVTIEWKDPQLAQSWANQFVHLANERLRARAIQEAQAALAFLRSEIDKTSIVGVREALYRLMEAQLKTTAMANVREEYAFRVIDGAALPDEHDVVRPRRALYGAAGASVSAVVFVLIARARRRRSGAGAARG